MSFYRRARLNAHSFLQASRGLREPGTARGKNLATIIGGMALGSWRETPPHSPNARGVGVKFCHGSLGNDIMIPINAD